MVHVEAAPGVARSAEGGVEAAPAAASMDSRMARTAASSEGDVAGGADADAGPPARAPNADDAGTNDSPRCVNASAPSNASVRTRARPPGDPPPGRDMRARDPGRSRGRPTKPRGPRRTAAPRGRLGRFESAALGTLSKGSRVPTRSGTADPRPG